MKATRMLVLFAALTTLGCYRAVVTTGRSESGEVIRNEWAHSFLGGLVPPKVVETASRCPNGLARVETQHSFLNMLAAGITGGLYTPMTIEVRCASGSGGAGARDASAAADKDAARALSDAARRSLESGEPVLVRLR